MSGGNYGYLYQRVEEFADDMLACMRTREPRAPIEVETARTKFAAHLRLVAQAMKAIEWVDSGDYGDGDEVEAIETALGEGK